jgi:hypothetical protein
MRFLSARTIRLGEEAPASGEEVRASAEEVRRSSAYAAATLDDRVVELPKTRARGLRVAERIEVLLEDVEEEGLVVRGVAVRVGHEVVGQERAELGGIVLVPRRVVAGERPRDEIDEGAGFEAAGAVGSVGTALATVGQTPERTGAPSRASASSASTR